MCLTLVKRERLLHDSPPPPTMSVQPSQRAKMTPWREQVCGTAWQAGVVAVVLLMCSASVTGNCLNHISVTGGATVTGQGEKLNVTLLLPETTEVGRLLYRLTWGEEQAAPSIPASEEFTSYFHVDDSVSGELSVLLKRSLVGMPDYPVLKTSFSAAIAFPRMSDGKPCSAILLHLLQDENTHAPTVQVSHSFLQVAKDIPVATQLHGFTVTIADNDATAPNNLMELAVEGACPLAVAAATEAKRFDGAAGQRHVVRLHLVSPLHDLGNKTFTCMLRVTDMGSPPLSSSVSFTLHVVDRDTPFPTTITTTTTSSDTLPQLALPFYVAEVWPGMDAGTPLATAPERVKVNGGDPTLQNVTYSLRDAWHGGNWSEYFAIDSTTGQVKLRKTMSATVTSAGGGCGHIVPLVIQAQDSIGRVSIAVLQVRVSHPQPSVPDCLHQWPTSRGRARLVFSRRSYNANVFPTDTFVGRVEAKVVGCLVGLVRYSWAPGTTNTGFLVNSISGVITMAPGEVSPGLHILTVRATVGHLTVTAQVTVQVLEGEEETMKQNGDEGVFMVLQSDSLRTCDPEEMLGLQVAVGVLALVLGLVLIAAGVAGLLLYRRRKARARTEVKHISTLGSAYPNLSFSRDSPE